MKRTLKIFLIISTILLIISIVIRLYSNSLIVSFFFTECDIQDMAENFENKNEEIKKLVQFLDNKITGDLSVEIEFAPINRITHFNIKKNNNDKYIKISDNYDISFKSEETKSALKLIGWNNEDLKELRKKMRKSNIIYVRTNKENISLAYKRVGLGTFYYEIFETELNIETRIERTNNCNSYFYKENVVFHYGSGAFGSLCTYQFKSENIKIK